MQFSRYTNVEKEVIKMNVKVKPIQPTPTLSGADAKKIIAEALKEPSKASIDHNKRMLELRKKAMGR